MKRILLVDDEPMARQHIRESFPWEKWGFEIAGEATNGSEALVLAAELRPDIALIDITMPVMDGLKLLDHMNQQFPDTKCIILTAHRDFVYAQQALQNGAFGYVLKSPIDLVGAKAALDRAAKASERELHHATTTKKQQILLQSNHYPLRKHFFEQVLSSLLAGDNEIIQRSETLGADLEAGSLLLLVCEVDRLPLFRSRYPETDHSLIEYSLLEIIRESLHEFIPGRFELFPIHFGKMALILTFEERLPDRETYQQLCIQIEQKVEEPLQKYLQLQISIAASEPFSQPHHIRSLYKQTSELLLYRFYQEHPRTIFTNGLFPLNPLSEKGLICLNETAAQIKDQTSADTLHQHYENIKLLLLQMRSKPADVI
ncbi:MAG TPA: response regulator, partial [Bacilli bacterium]